MTATVPSAGDPSRPAGRADAEIIALAAAATLDWRTLDATSAIDNPFFHAPFVAPSAEGLGAALQLVTVRGPAGRPAGLAPVTATRLGRVAPMLTVFAHDYAPFGMPLATDGVAETAARLARGLLDAAGPGRGVLFPFLEDGAPATNAIASAALAAGRPVVRLAAHARAAVHRGVDATDPREALPTKKRKEYARQIRRMADLGPVTLEVVVEPGDVPVRFEEFLELEAAGWKGKRGSAMAALPKVAAFARRAVAGLAGNGRCRILSLRVGGRPAAMLVCFIAGGTAFTWKIAYDESLARFSPGAQLMLDAPPLLFADPAIRRIDSCAAPNHPMIDHLWRGRLPLVTLVVGPARRRALFRAGLLSHAAEDRARRLARAWQNRGRRATRSG
ncbi:MAG: GNAT family N-acetyltransferase [Bauldia sp.]|nr:GNAT family N-acetyltransferase [Bauldia sp.]